MTVKEDKKKWNIPWKGIKTTFIVLVLLASVIFGIISIINNNRSIHKESMKKQDTIFKTKVNDIISKKYDIACKKKIILLSNYKVVKVADTYRVVVGENTKDLDETYTVSQCNVIYNITKEIK